MEGVTVALWWSDKLTQFPAIQAFVIQAFVIQAQVCGASEVSAGGTKLGTCQTRWRPQVKR